MKLPMYVNYFEEKLLKDSSKDFSLSVGDVVRVGSKIVEGNKTRVQIFEGTILSLHKAGINTTFTVRKVIQGFGVEKVFLFHSPKVVSVEKVRSHKVRRSKLYYLRNLKGKAARLKQSF